MDEAADEGRFWALVDRSAGPDACWPWLGPARGPAHALRRLDPNAADIVRSPVLGGASNRSARRVAYELTRGPIPAGDRIYVTCGESLCLQPQHLMLGRVQQGANWRHPTAAKPAPDRGRPARRTSAPRLSGRPAPRPFGSAQDQGERTGIRPARQAGRPEVRLTADPAPAVGFPNPDRPCDGCAREFGLERQRSIDERICQACFAHDPGLSLDAWRT